MFINVLKSKIHRATVTEADIEYIGSITIDIALMEAAQIGEYEKVQVVDVDNGERLETYVISGERGSGIICLNGAAARKVTVGDKVIIMTYGMVEKDEKIDPIVVLVDDKNVISGIYNYEKHGKLVLGYGQ